MWMKYPGLQRALGRSKLLRQCTLGLLARIELLVLAVHKEGAIVATLRACRRPCESLQTGNEAFLLYSLAHAQQALGGAMAEVGVYEGSSARILCEAKDQCALHMFDTFAGMPQPNDSEARAFAPGDYSGALPKVQALLAGYSNVHFHPGLFPDSSASVAQLCFSLVHLDVDLYASTLAAFEFFYPRMLRGGVIITHDYSVLSGVAEATRSFLADKPEQVIELPTTQAMVVKL